MREIADGHILILVDEEPVAGGNLIINVDRVIGRLSPGAAHGEKLNGNLGFRVHQCRREAQ